MKRITVAVSTLVLSACGSEPTAARTPMNSHLTPGAVTAKGVSTSLTIAIDDALERVLPALDEPTAVALKGPLMAVRAAMKQRDGAALQGAIAVAREALERPAAANDDRAPDLAVIALALDAAAAVK